MTRYVLAFAVILLSPLAAQAAVPTKGWWVVEKAPSGADLQPGTAVRFSADETAWILANGDIDRWQTHLEPEADHFVLRRGGFAGLLVKDGKRWVLQEKPPPAEGILLRPADSAETARFDKTLSATPDIASTCDRARQCCQDAMTRLGATCRLAEEFPPPPSLLSCQRFLKGMAEILDLKSTAAPASCVLPKNAPRR